ncbi:T6SS effector amidase Tae4 family protein [Chryseobacterium sp. P1-3]|uniref:T6SS effector amidase Tae4 family protein n=1 Tax=Chryseobacterium sp. (strain P1-3) TaxID=1517683 RepID=UPI000A458876|nr:T6SS effector amidase Tae4 family protein [Chryseobacterium sp. P1-3]
MNIEKLIPIILEQRRSFVAQSGSQTTKPVQVKRPSWADMIKNYPNTSVKTIPLYNEIGNGLTDLFNKAPDDWENTCSFRMSKGLNYSGFKLPYNNAKYRAKGAKGGVHIGKDKLNYWYRVKELGKYLEEHLGTPEFDEKLKKVGLGQIKIGLSKDKWDSLYKIKGIIMFKVSGWGKRLGPFHFMGW